nr:DNA translocase FtsK [Chitinispirillaceae bacterium]
MKRSEKDDDEEGTASEKKAAHADFGHEIWGLVYIALSVLVLIALVSHFVSRGTTNVLGQYLGTALAAGLVYLFGRLVVFLFPAIIGYLGWCSLRNDPVNMRSLLLASLLGLETCVLLAIRKLPLIAAGKAMVLESNWIGVSIVGLMKMVFGAHPFGPYFITGIALIVTVLLALRVSPKRAGAAIAAFVKALYARIVGLVSGQNDADEQEETEPEAARPDEVAPARRGRSNRPPPAAPAVLTIPDAAALQAAITPPAEADPVEEERRKLFSEQLKAFRDKKNEPIKIMTVETHEVEPVAAATEEIDATQVGRQLEEKERLEKEEKKKKRAAAKLAAGEADPVGSETGEPMEPTLAPAGGAEQEKPYEIPSPSVIEDPPPLSSMVDDAAIQENSRILVEKLLSFGVEGKVEAVSPGPVVTRYEIVLAPGTRINKVVNLQKDLELAVRGKAIRIEAPIPGKSAVGIELPNENRQTVYFKHVLTSDAFAKAKAKLPIIIGSNISGAPFTTDIAKMPHMLIAGQTGSGKSVCINSLICSMLMTRKPDELRLILIDPKKVELSNYNDIPHLLAPVVTEVKEAVKALIWGTHEMERRYRLLASVGSRNIDAFNSRVGSDKFNEVIKDPNDNKPLPFIVIVVDELAELMSQRAKDVEVLIQRIAQLARAVGIHLIIATQRPSVDIITGPIKANLTSRIAFRTIQGNDSRTIIDQVGAEKLLGNGDMLFLRNGAPQVERFHGAFLSEEDVERIVSEVKKQKVNLPKFENFGHVQVAEDEEEDGPSGGGASGGARDEMFEEAARIIVSVGLGSTSLLQRRLNLGYARAGRVMDQLQEAGIVGPPNGSKAREVIARPDEIDDVLA